MCVSRLGNGVTDLGPERSVAKLNREWLTKSMQINAIGHVMMVQSLYNSFTLNSKKKEDLSKIVNISARVGSISG